jgi:hypothetical protein
MSATREIPQGLRITYLASFVFTLIFGLAGTFAAKLVGDIAGHPVRDVDVNVMLGVASLAFALGSWLAYRATTWEQISILTTMLTFCNLFGGVFGIIGYFSPSIFGLSEPYPPVQLLVAVVLTAFGIAFAYFYIVARPARSSSQNEASARAR